MCGLTGFFAPGALDAAAADALRPMIATLAHRGPDDEGSWIDEHAGVALGHRRLSIVDLSAQGHQPMVSPSGRYVLVLNGEIYNFRALREELTAQGATFQGRSDTEVLLAAFERWGVEGAVQRSAGMFAFALFDRRERALHLGRDRIGEKPLYYGWSGGLLLFGSELKSLCAHPRFSREIDSGALALFLRYGYVPAPYSIYKGVRKVRPGTIVTVSAAGEREQAYWSARTEVERGLHDPLRCSPEEAVSALEAQLRATIREQMVADVPVGAFLSGGVDSSLIVALMQAEGRAPVRTFTIGFHEQGYDEAEHARAVAAHLGTDHTELYVTPAEAMAVIPELPRSYDEPFADTSAIPTLLLSRLARRQVTVSLSGDGGDEFWGGYNRYFWGQRLLRLFRGVPAPVRRLGAGALRALPPQRWDALARSAMAAIPRRFRISFPGEQVHKLAGVLAVGSAEEMYRTLVSNWAETPVLGAVEPPTLLDDGERPACRSDAERMMYLDLMSYLPDNNLVKVDRASMAVGLETRAPLVDHRLVEFAFRVPHELKLREGQGKWLLKQVLGRFVPPRLFDRPKMGFGVPTHDWLRGALRGWAEELLRPERLRREGYLDAAAVTALWREHLGGRQNRHRQLWALLMFQAWLEQGAGAGATRPAATAGRSTAPTAAGRAAHPPR